MRPNWTPFLLPSLAALLVVSQVACNKGGSDAAPATGASGEVAQAAKANDGVARPDWPGWLGPARNGIIEQPKITQNWKKQAPKLAWKKAVAAGFSSFSTAGGRVFSMYSTGADEFVAAFDVASGKELWKFKTGGHFEDYQGGHGPRVTPVTDGPIVYAVGATGLLVALKQDDGSVIWQRNLPAELKAEVPRWGFSGSPLIENDLLILNVGAAPDHSLVAFEKATGKVRWHVQADPATYASPIGFTVGGERLVAYLTPTRLIVVSAADGRFHFEHPVQTEYKVNSSTPVFVGPDKLFVSTSSSVSGTLLQISVAGGKASGKVLWNKRTLSTNHSTPVLKDGFLYGFDNSRLVCVDLKTGDQRWNQRGFGQGSVTLVNGQLVIVSDDGVVALAEAKPDAFVELGRMEVFDSLTWTPAVVGAGRLFVRSHTELRAYDLRL